MMCSAASRAVTDDIRDDFVQRQRQGVAHVGRQPLGVGELLAAAHARSISFGWLTSINVTCAFVRSCVLSPSSHVSARASPPPTRRAVRRGGRPRSAPAGRPRAASRFSAPRKSWITAPALHHHQPVAQVAPPAASSGSPSGSSAGPCDDLLAEPDDLVGALRVERGRVLVEQQQLRPDPRSPSAASAPGAGRPTACRSGCRGGPRGPC